MAKLVYGMEIVNGVRHLTCSSPNPNWTTWSVPVRANLTDEQLTQYIAGKNA